MILMSFLMTSNHRRFAPRHALVAGVLALSGCSTPPHAPPGTPGNATSAARATTSPSTSAPSGATSAAPRHEIVRGIGLAECPLGARASCLIERFGAQPSTMTPHVTAEHQGLEAALSDDGRIVTLFFHFLQWPDHPFDGRTREGIGRESTEADVVRAYGPPEQVRQSVISAYGARPGAHEKVLAYRSQGLIFTFWDGRLADIRVLTVRKTD